MSSASFFFSFGGGEGEGGERGLFQSGGPKSNPCLNFQLDLFSIVLSLIPQSHL